MPQNIVESVVVQLMSYLLDHILIGCHDIFIHNIRVLVFKRREFCLRIKNEILASSLLPSCNVLDAESV